jgi:hypothetical protein
LAWRDIVNGPGRVILIIRSVLARRNSTSRTSTGRSRRIGPTMRGTTTVPLVRPRTVAGWSRSTPERVIAKRFD